MKSTSSPPPTTQSAAKPPAGTRARLIEAARAEFSEKGIECATTRGIAERAACNEVTLFRHFESKQKLLAAVVQETTDDFRELCELPLRMKGELRGDLLRLVEIHNRCQEKCEGMCRALIGEAKRQPTLTKELIGNVMEPFHQSIATYLRAQVEAGKVREDVRAYEFAEIFTATLLGAMLRRTSGLSKLDREAWIRETAELFARALEPR